MSAFNNVFSLVTIGLLPLSAVNAQQSVPPKSVDRSQRQICKTETAIGSLIPGAKKCHTAAEWEALAREGQSNARAMVDMPAGPGSGH